MFDVLAPGAVVGVTFTLVPHHASDCEPSKRSYHAVVNHGGCLKQNKGKVKDRVHEQRQPKTDASECAYARV